MQAIFSTIMPLILASSSPRRQLFLQELGIEYSLVCPPNVEPLPYEGENPTMYARRAALSKARATLSYLKTKQSFVEPESASVILAADTVVALGDTILGKPQDATDALRMLSLLAGKKHTVISAVVLLFSTLDEYIFHDSTDVYMHAWSHDILTAYAHCGEPLDKAGAYAVQGQGAFLVQKIHGSWSTVVGLPLTQVTQALLQRGVIAVR